MLSPMDEIESALDTLALPKYISRTEIKHQYHRLAKKNHPDTGGSAIRMEALNHAYSTLIQYIENFRYTFDEEEIYKQFSGANYVHRFNP